MDTRTRSASPHAPVAVKMESTPPPQDKVSAYYSLVFPHITFYSQTLSVTIGRRCASNPNAATSSTSEREPVDVDLGALKSVSRLHAKIEFDSDDERFVLVVIGRNGAWVDGVWSASGTRAPLGERSQIQIASRTFHFVLPPPAPPDDSPSPSSQSSANRLRSPSVDITSISPPSSQPSHTPPPPPKDIKPPSPSPEPQIPAAISPPPPKPRPLLASPQLPNSNSIGKSNKAAASKKRKKGDVEPPAPPKPKPEDMPPKPSFTYAQLIYKAIKAIGEKATLQEICNWIMNTHEYYRYSDASWMSSVRHNLSSSKAFQKLERCGGDRGKGFFWKLDGEHSHTLEEQETKMSQSAAVGGSQGMDGHVRSRKRDKGAALEPALKRSVKGDLKGAPLPPPLTSAPLAMKASSLLTTNAAAPAASASTTTSPTLSKGTPTTTSATTGVFAYPTHHAHMTTIPQPSTVTSGYTGSPITAPNPYAAWTMHPVSAGNGAAHTSPTPATTAPSSPPPVPSISTVPPAQSPPPPAPPPMAQPSNHIVPDVSLPIVLGPIPPTHPDYSPTHPHNSAKEGYMILHERRLILDPDVFGGLTKETLEGLEKMGMIGALQFLKDHMVKALKQRRAKGRNRVKRMRAGKKPGGTANPLDPPLTNAPLERKLAPGATGGPPLPFPVTASVPDPVPMDIGPPVDAGSPIVIIDDSDDEGPAAKRRKVNEVLVI
ncbi:hypothetical protein C0991_003070 [Blastosporella zonata]|nr:hypothetical protein C0991_003070 [Blastosporella zonata]